MNCIKKQHPLSLAVVSNGQQDSSSLSAVFWNKNKHLVHFFGISHKKTKNSHQNVWKSRLRLDFQTFWFEFLVFLFEIPKKFTKYLFLFWKTADNSQLSCCPFSTTARLKESSIYMDVIENEKFSSSFSTSCRWKYSILGCVLNLLA